MRSYTGEDYARTTSKKVRDIKAIKREDGETNGGFPPYGYLPNPDGGPWLYDTVAGEIKKQMYMWSASGMSDIAIAKKLNLLGIPNPTAYKKSIGLKYFLLIPLSPRMIVWAQMRQSATNRRRCSPYGGAD